MSGRLPTLVPLDFDLERIAERARRRDLFAAAALAGLLARDRSCPSEVADKVWRWADAMIAAGDATYESTSASVPPAPVSRPPETGRTQREGA